MSHRGELLFVREDTLFAQPFDSGSLELSGNPVVVAENVSFTRHHRRSRPPWNSKGTLVYVTNGQPRRQLMWYDRTGKELGQVVALENRLRPCRWLPVGSEWLSRVESQPVCP